jgi:nitroreductase
VDVLQAISTRRSIRNFRGDPVPDQMVQTLLEAAMQAPSAGNQQPWQFMVISERALLDAVARFHPYAQMCLSAPLAILICGNVTDLRHEGMWSQDCAAATQNLLLAAHALGLGAVWVGVLPNAERMKAFSALLKLPPHIVPFSLIPCGFPGEEKPPVKRFDPARVHHNGW